MSVNNPQGPFDLQYINQKLAELDALKQKVEKIYSLSEVGDEVRKELEEYKAVREHGVQIPHLEKEFADQIYPSRGGRKVKRRPLTESEVKEALEKSPSAIKAARRLGVSYQTFKKYTKMYGVHLSLIHI